MSLLADGMQAEVDLIPLMMQQGFKAKGWLGLILGQSVYYAFHPKAVPTDEKFLQQMDALIREIGDRGMIKTTAFSEGVPPRAPAPAPVFEPTPEPAPAPAPPPAAVPTTPSDRDFTPSMQLATPMRQHLSSSESSALVERLLDEARSDRVAMEARLDAKIAELAAPAPAAISDEQVARIQTRLEGLHAAKLLTDEVRQAWLMVRCVLLY